MTGSREIISSKARWTRWFVIAILVATVAVEAAALFPDSTHVRLHSVGQEPFGRVIRIAHSLLIIVAMLQLVLLLREVEQGDLFSSRVTRRLRAFALFTMLAILVGAVTGPLVSLLTGCPPGRSCPHRIPIDMRALWSLVISLVFFLVARLFDEARRIDEDNRQII